MDAPHQEVASQLLKPIKTANDPTTSEAEWTASAIKALLFAYIPTLHFNAAKTIFPTTPIMAANSAFLKRSLFPTYSPLKRKSTIPLDNPSTSLS